MSEYHEDNCQFGGDQAAKPATETSDLSPDPSPEFAPLARTRRTRIRAKSEKGLPSDETLARLARKYLELQTKSWPQLVEAGLLMPATNELVAEMVRDFKDRHRSGKVDHQSLLPVLAVVAVLAGMYCRYSCDNSSDLSIDDQMTKILIKAKENGHFVPWCYVFCDYSATGRDASRQGYTSYKKALEDKDSRIAKTWIDDFTRASRDEIEWWRLAALTKRLGKGLQGASDAFNLSDANS